MEICIQNYKTMKKECNPDNEVLSVRIRGAEAFRFCKLMNAAIEKNKHTDKTNIIRELLSLDPPYILTAADIEYFRTGNKEQSKVRRIADEKITMLKPKNKSDKENAA